MRFHALSDIQSFLVRNRLMDEVHSVAGYRRFLGKYQLFGRDTDGRVLDDWFDLDIAIPTGSSRSLPRVSETAGRIPRTPEYHVNGDGTLCLGSPVRMATDLLGRSILFFEETYLVPYLFKVVAKMRGIADGFLGGELAHGLDGLLDDLGEMLEVSRTSTVRDFLRLALTKKRIANKRPCPCGCGRRFGRCHRHFSINAIRNSIPKALIRSQLASSRTSESPYTRMKSMKSTHFDVPGQLRRRD